MTHPLHETIQVIRLEHHATMTLGLHSTILRTFLYILLSLLRCKDENRIQYRGNMIYFSVR